MGVISDEMRGGNVKSTDTHLVAGFLLKEQERFFAYLDDCAIEPTEGSLIIEEIISESDGRFPTCVEQFSGFIGD
jgi:hypothetical protein